MSRPLTVLAVAALLLFSAAGSALEPPSETDPAPSIGADQVQADQRGDGYVVAVQLPEGLPADQVTELPVALPTDAAAATGEGSHLVLTVDPNPLCGEAAGLASPLWDVDASLTGGEDDEPVPALPGYGGPGPAPSLAEVERRIEEAKAEIDQLAALLEGTTAAQEARELVGIAQRAIDRADERIAWLQEAGQTVTDIVVAGTTATAEGALEEAHAQLADAGLGAEIGDGQPGEALSAVDDAWQAVQDAAGEDVHPPDVSDGGRETVVWGQVQAALDALGSLDEDDEDDEAEEGDGGEDPGPSEDEAATTVAEALTQAEQALAEAQATADEETSAAGDEGTDTADEGRQTAEDAIATAEEETAFVQQALAVMEQAIERQTSTEEFDKIHSYLAQAQAAADDLKGTLDEAEDDPAPDEVDQAIEDLGYLVATIEQLGQEAKQQAGAATDEDPSPDEVRIFLTEEEDDAGGEDQLPSPDGAPGDEGLVDDAETDPDAGQKPTPPEGQDAEDACRQGTAAAGSQGVADDGDDDGSGDGTDGGNGGEEPSGDEDPPEDENENGSSDDGGEGGDPDDSSSSSSSEDDTVELALEPGSLSLTEGQEATVTATVTNPSDERRSYDLVAEDEGPFSVTANGDTHVELDPGEERALALRVSPLDDGGGTLTVDAVGETDDATVSAPVTIDAAEGQLRLDVSQRNLALAVDETRTLGVTVENVGDGRDEVQLVVDGDGAVDASFAADPTTVLDPGEAERFELTLEPTRPGQASLGVEVTSDDGAQLGQAVLVDARSPTSTQGQPAREGASATEQQPGSEEAKGVPFPALAALAGLLLAARTRQERP